MAKKLRYTGDWPPPEVLARYPNWEMAYEEEGVEGQDESTLRPQKEQRRITSDTVHTAGDVWLADGRTYPAIITVALGTPSSCWFHDGKRWWAMQTFRKKWEPQGTDSVDMKDKSTFPLRFRTRLPKWDGKPWQLEIRPNGTQKEWK
jgi:hypothetical protein